jgi:transposase-like protein
VKTSDLCREHGISAATLYGWKQKFGGLDVSEAQLLKAMEDENRRLKPLVAECHRQLKNPQVGRDKVGTRLGVCGGGRSPEPHTSRGRSG